MIIAAGYSEMPGELRGKIEHLGNPFLRNDLNVAFELTFKWQETTKK